MVKEEQYLIVGDKTSSNWKLLEVPRARYQTERAEYRSNIGE